MAKKNLSDFDKIIVLDFGSQYNQLITRRIRDFGIYSELLPHDLSIEKIKEMAPKGIIFSGGPNSVYDKGALKVDPEIFKLGIPILGICYGMQLMSYDLGGKVEKADNSEYGRADIEVTDPNAVLFSGLPREQYVWMSHGDLVTKAPEGFTVTAKSKNCPISAIANDEKKFYGIQFHAEVRNSEYGLDILKNFAFKVCGAEANWTMDDFIEMQVDEIRKKVGDKKVILGLSGGVDSSVTATLLHKAIGDQLTAIFVDHGMLRKDEGDQVMQALNKDLGVNIIRVNAQERFLNKLKGVTDPEQKRKIIGGEFIRVFEEEARKLDGIDFLAQGTIYPDIVESGTKTAKMVKSHHNVGGLPEDLQFELVEPLRQLFKDEVRACGVELGLPYDMVYRQPFPGPGLGVRCLGAITRDRLEAVRESDAILREEFKNAGLDKKVWQYFTVVPDFKSVGVRDNARSFEWPVIIRAVNTVDAMTATIEPVDWPILMKITDRILKEVKNVNRVCYDMSPKPNATIEWE